MLLSDVSQIITLPPSGNKKDFMCVYECGMFIARIAENILFIVCHKATMLQSLLPSSFTSAQNQLVRKVVL